MWAFDFGLRLDMVRLKAGNLLQHLLEEGQLVFRPAWGPGMVLDLQLVGSQPHHPSSYFQHRWHGSGPPGCVRKSGTDSGS